MGDHRTVAERRDGVSSTRRRFVLAAGALAAFGGSAVRIGPPDAETVGSGGGMPVVAARLRYDVDAGADVEHDCGRSHVRGDPANDAIWLSLAAFARARDALADAEGLAVVQSRSLLAAADGVFGTDVFGSAPTARLPLDAGRSVRVFDGVAPPSVDLARAGAAGVRVTVAGASTVLPPEESGRVTLPDRVVTVRVPTGRTREAPGKRPGETVTVPAFEAVERPATPTVTVDNLGVRAVRPFGG